VAETTASFPMETCLDQNPAADPVWLLEGLRSGDENAYEALVSRFQQPVYNLVYRLMDDPADASDVVQEVFLKVFRNVSSFRGNSSLKTWIYRIAVNEAYNQRRWFSRHRKKQIGLESEEDGTRGLQDVLSDPGRSPFDLASGVETRALVEQALTEVNPVFRAAVILRDMEDMSYEEVADVLQVSLGTVKSRILRGREALRGALTGRLELETDLHFKHQTAEPV
jgi:RNA polymerase sigma-70 factor, ECF subfamily